MVNLNINIKQFYNMIRGCEVTMPIEVAFRVFNPEEKKKLDKLNKKKEFKGSNYKGIIMVEDEKKDNSSDIDLSFSRFVDYENDSSNSYEQEPQKHRGRPKKENIELANTVKTKKEKTPLNSDVTYQSTYGATTALLAQSISQIDDLNSKIAQDLEAVRNSRQLKRKYDYICELSGTMTGLVGNKINAIREMNNTITNSHKLELSKTKELKLNEQVDDDKRIMDLYNAYINAPVGSMQQAMMQSSPYAGVTAEQLNSPIIRADTQSTPIADSDPGFTEYLNNLSPQQNAMLQENNPNIQTVLAYNQSTQERLFKVINIQTGEDIPNMPIPSDEIKNKLQIDIKNGCARSVELNTTYPLQLYGNRLINEY